MSETVLYIEVTRTDGATITISFKEPVSGISAQFLKNIFLPVASPVLGIKEITSADYLNIKRIDLEG